MNPGEQFIQLARRGNPEQGVHRFIADVLVAVLAVLLPHIAE